MERLVLKINNPDTYQHLVRLLKQFDKSEVEIIEQDELFTRNRSHLQNELSNIDSGASTMMGLDELNEELEKIISKSENKNL